MSIHVESTSCVANADSRQLTLRTREPERVFRADMNASSNPEQQEGFGLTERFQALPFGAHSQKNLVDRILADFGLKSFWQTWQHQPVDFFGKGMTYVNCPIGLQPFPTLKKTKLDFQERISRSPRTSAVQHKFYLRGELMSCENNFQIWKFPTSNFVCRGRVKGRCRNFQMTS